jgi:hypothetical protein
MKDADPLVTRLRELPSPLLDEPLRARVLRRAEAELGDRQRVWRAYREWSSWALPAVLVACEAVYVIEVIAKVRLLFG